MPSGGAWRKFRIPNGCCTVSPLHKIGNGCFDTKICMYNAHKLVKTEEKHDEN
jgi:hypothetical protein